MKKLIFAIAILFSVSATMISCTEENVTPQNTEDPVGGGSPQYPKL